MYCYIESLKRASADKLTRILRYYNPKCQNRSPFYRTAFYYYYFCCSVETTMEKVHSRKVLRVRNAIQALSTAQTICATVSVINRPACRIVPVQVALLMSCMCHCYKHNCLGFTLTFHIHRLRYVLLRECSWFEFNRFLLWGLQSVANNLTNDNDWNFIILSLTPNNSRSLKLWPLTQV